jgi:hypothetical protein
MKILISVLHSCREAIELGISANFGLSLLSRVRLSRLEVFFAIRSSV